MSTVCGRPKASGQPCGWKLNSGECPYHGPASTPESRSELARVRGLLAGRSKRMRTAMSTTTPEPPFDTIENIIAWSQRMARAALVEDVDPRRLAEARGFAQLALSALAAQTQARLVDALLKVEHGGAAMLLLSRLTNGLEDGRRKPLPGRTLTVVPRPDPDPEPDPGA
jgi:hypothetical protein